MYEKAEKIKIIFLLKYYNKTYIQSTFNCFKECRFCIDFHICETWTTKQKIMYSLFSIPKCSSLRASYLWVIFCCSSCISTLYILFDQDNVLWCFVSCWIFSYFYMIFIKYKLHCFMKVILVWYFNAFLKRNWTVVERRM